MAATNYVKKALRGEYSPQALHIAKTGDMNALICLAEAYASIDEAVSRWVDTPENITMGIDGKQYRKGHRPLIEMAKICVNEFLSNVCKRIATLKKQFETPDEGIKAAALYVQQLIDAECWELKTNSGLLGKTKRIAKQTVIYRFHYLSESYLDAYDNQCKDGIGFLQKVNETWYYALKDIHVHKKDADYTLRISKDIVPQALCTLPTRTKNSPVRTGEAASDNGAPTGIYSASSVQLFGESPKKNDTSKSGSYKEDSKIFCGTPSLNTKESEKKEKSDLEVVKNGVNAVSDRPTDCTSCESETRIPTKLKGENKVAAAAAGGGESLALDSLAAAQNAAILAQSAELLRKAEQGTDWDKLSPSEKVAFEQQQNNQKLNAYAMQLLVMALTTIWRKRGYEAKDEQVRIDAAKMFKTFLQREFEVQNAAYQDKLSSHKANISAKIADAESRKKAWLKFLNETPKPMEVAFKIVRRAIILAHEYSIRGGYEGVVMPSFGKSPYMALDCTYGFARAVEWANKEHKRSLITNTQSDALLRWNKSLAQTEAAISAVNKAFAAGDAGTLRHTIVEQRKALRSKLVTNKLDEAAIERLLNQFKSGINYTAYFAKTK